MADTDAWALVSLRTLEDVSMGTVVKTGEKSEIIAAAERFPDPSRGNARICEAYPLDQLEPRMRGLDENKEPTNPWTDEELQRYIALKQLRAKRQDTSDPELREALRRREAELRKAMLQYVTDQ